MIPDQRQVRGDLFCYEGILLSLADGGCVGLKSGSLWFKREGTLILNQYPLSFKLKSHSRYSCLWSTFCLSAVYFYAS